MKRGRFSEEELQYLRDNCDTKTYEELAKVLDRDINSVKDKVENTIGKNISESKALSLTAEYDIQKSPVWLELKMQFSKTELDSFLYHWGKIVAQFREDIFHTEEIQIIDLCKLEILMNRVLINQHKGTELISDAEKELDIEKMKDKDDRDINRVMELEKNIAFARAAQSEYSREYRELHNKKATSLRELKGTREQRIKKLEDSKQTFIGWLGEVITNRELRKSLGLRIEKMRLSMEGEAIRLSQYHTYEDSQIDRPILTPECVLKELDEESKLNNNNNNSNSRGNQ